MKDVINLSDLIAHMDIYVMNAQQNLIENVEGLKSVLFVARNLNHTQRQEEIAHQEEVLDLLGLLLVQNNVHLFIMVERKKFRRDCKKCGNEFLPQSKWNWVCNDCKDEKHLARNLKERCPFLDHRIYCSKKIPGRKRSMIKRSRRVCHYKNYHKCPLYIESHTKLKKVSQNGSKEV